MEACVRSGACPRRSAQCHFGLVRACPGTGSLLPSHTSPAPVPGHPPQPRAERQPAGSCSPTGQFGAAAVAFAQRFLHCLAAQAWLRLPPVGPVTHGAAGRYHLRWRWAAVWSSPFLKPNTDAGSRLPAWPTGALCRETHSLFALEKRRAVVAVPRGWNSRRCSAWQEKQPQG